MVTIPVAKATAAATISSPEITRSEFNAEYSEAPILAGMLIKKLRTNASRLSMPRPSNVAIVNPDRLSPGITENPWAIPEKIESGIDKVDRSRFSGGFLRSWTPPFTSMKMPMIPIADVPTNPETWPRINNSKSPRMPLSKVDMTRNKRSGEGMKGFLRTSTMIWATSARNTTNAAGNVPTWSHRAYITAFSNGSSSRVE